MNPTRSSIAATVAVALLAVGCAGAPVQPTGSPSASSTASMSPTTSVAPTGAIPTPSATASPSPTLSPTVAPTASPTAPSPTPTASASPSPSPQAGWQLIADFPAQNATSVDAIRAVGGGFVAIGSVFDDTAACFNDARHGRVWTSADGRAWTPAPDDTFAQAELQLLVEHGGALLVIGVVGSADPGSSCNPPAEPGFATWRSTDDGASWQRLGRASGLDGARLTDVAVSDIGLVAVGAAAPGEANHAGVWISSDGLAWQPAESAPASESRLNTIAARDNRVVAFADCCDDPLAWISRDGGRNWFEASVTIPLVGPDDIAYPPTVGDIAVVGNGFVAVGYACCLDPTPDQVPIVLTSADGEDWSGAWLAVEHEEVSTALTVLPDARLVAVGNGTYETGTRPPSDRSRFGGRSWISADGTAWRAGPRFMELNQGLVSAVAAGPSGVVVAGAAAGPGGPRVWFAPLGTFD